MKIGNLFIDCRRTPDRCEPCGRLEWWAYLKPTLMRFEDSPVSCIWRWAFWCGPLHLHLAHPDEGLHERFAEWNRTNRRIFS